MLWLLSPLVSFHSLSCSPLLLHSASPLPLPLSLSFSLFVRPMLCLTNRPSAPVSLSHPSGCPPSVSQAHMCTRARCAHKYCSLAVLSPAAPCTKTDQHKCAVHTCMNTLLCSMMGCCLFDCDTTVPCVVITAFAAHSG